VSGAFDSGRAPVHLPRASRQDDPHPRPQMIRREWADLCGQWGFMYDDLAVGEAEQWYLKKEDFDRVIQVPFPPESSLSGIGDDGFHDVVWYRREISAEEITRSGWSPHGRPRLLLHFGAVDYRCSVWLNGTLIGRHEGGHTPFEFEVQDVLEIAGPQVLVVRAEDRASDVGQPRGKQDWQRDPHLVWYRRTTGIWQPVWLEATPLVAINKVHWTVDIPRGFVVAELSFSGNLQPRTRCQISLRSGDAIIGAVTFDLTNHRIRQSISIPKLLNGQGYEDLLWSPHSPTLIDATIEILGDDADAVASYLGITTSSVRGGTFLLNDRPFYVTSILSQGYWPESHLAAPSPSALREEVELILSLGFNSARVHQKAEDPRFLYWADRLGLTLWGEAPAAFEFSATAVQRTTREWMEILDRDRSHPSVITWVPINESWGIQQIAHDPAQFNFAQALAALTKAIDPTRPVISNDGWEHASSDIVTIHDYSDDVEELENRYGPDASPDALLRGIGPAGRQILLAEGARTEAPIMLTEFGGIKYSTAATDVEAWGYSTVATAKGFEQALADLFETIGQNSWLGGICYTQLTDTMQEANGLLDDRRVPKVDIARIRAIVTGERLASR
jgi:beta-galactosidase/beta-glucuronidase